MPDERKTKILLVDDEEIIRLYFQDIFWIYNLENHCELALAASLDEAEALIFNPATRPDILFLDLSLPQAGGGVVLPPERSFQLLEKIKKDAATTALRVFVFSGHSEEEIEKEALAKGAERFIHKAENLPQDLVEVVKTLVGPVTAGAVNSHA
ncbi:MAG TPA: response regulator [Candidatus Paceibacterota bacterium]|nr:response regulator [Candidatus Paceibacterota bacterium]